MTFAKIPKSLLIIIAMFMGAIIGAYGGEVYPGVNIMADAFVTLLQMTALPYISFSLIVGIGGLSSTKAMVWLKQGFIIMLGLLAVMLFFIFMSPLAFPDWVSADFYSASTVKVQAELNLVDLFIQSNPFYAYANTLIPAIVMFSILVGIGLTPIRNKKQTLLILSNFVSSLGNINAVVMKLAPLGVFCIGLRAAATIESSQIEGLLVYIVTASVLVTLLSFIVLPSIVAIITPFRYGDILKATREALVTAFATGSFFVVIPTIVEKTRLLIHNQYKNINAEKVPEVLVPITFSLPIGGKLIALLFTLFAAWFSGAYISMGDYINLVIIGVPQLFGTTTIAMPSLLEAFNVSSTMFDLFLVSENIIVNRLGAILSVIVSACFSLLLATYKLKNFTFNSKTFIRYLVIIPCVSSLLFLGLGYGFNQISHQYEGYSKFIDRDFLFDPVISTQLSEPNQTDVLSAKQSTNALERIKARGFIRVGYFRDDLPYAFQNKEGKLVGFDIELMHQLASDLNVDIQFVLIFHKEAESLLKSGYLDITTGFPVIPDNMAKYTLTVPYSEQVLAFLVKDNRRAEFTQWRTILKRKDLTIGIPETFYYEDAVKHHFTEGKAWNISTPRLFFKEEYQHIDGMLFGAAAASGWTLLYPDYTVVVPKPARSPIAMAFPLNQNDNSFELFMRNWISMKKRNGTLDVLFKYWIEGKTP